AHLPRELRARQDPAASQAADAVNLGQAACHYKLGPKAEGRSRRSLVNRIQINFIDQHERANAARDAADFLQNRIWRKRACWIVQIGDHDEPRLWRYAIANRLWIYGPAVFVSAGEAFHISVQIAGNIENWCVRRMLD